ncbi:TonB-dependent siderophore receptor [Thiomicrorhabdus sp. zzn3]|uniref:TonB-dependent receptor n=1 Tax=Thiomicrorhabdus sp. zzn3 TaxID=3039775 RepID=UPI002436EFED|nr:TonB-dependent siderophore receptor [Thiomicrorhabdus sp. zzn3]MDG6778390.1 TonB-dependent siderophore receptor [Thiomicrorhabdus sp. zzn3]
MSIDRLKSKQTPLANGQIQFKADTSLRNPSLKKAGTAVGLGVAVSLSAAPVWAQDEVFEMDALQVEERTIDTNPYAEPGAPYKAKVSGDKRHVKPIAETPQTIQVLTKTQIEESGKSDLKEIVQSQPGITLGTGENGNAFGDRYVIRGHEARSDVFVDGLRDPGMTTRESFATEQIEITKGPSSTFAGRGSTGGAVNSITKQASTEYDLTKLSGGVGSDDYHRYTLDSNVKLSDDAAVRLNVLQAYEEVPDRAPADRQRDGIALSGKLQATDKLEIIADYYHLDAKDSPDLGSYIDRTTGKPNDDIPVYLQDQDFLDSEVDTFTLRLGYQANDHLRIENATRYGTTDNGYVTTGARGTTTDASDPNGAYDTISLSTHQGWQEVEYFANQLNAYWDTEIGGKKNQFVFGAEFSDHKVLNGVYDITNAGESNCLVSGRGGVSEGYCIEDVNGNTVPGINYLMGRQIQKGDWDSDWQVKTISLSAMDTVDVTDKFSVFAGLRYDQFDYDLSAKGRDGTISEYSYDDGLWNGHMGLVYKVADNGNVYFNYSTASNINGGESDVGTNSGYGGFIAAADSEPETTQNLELGTKWEFNGGKLLATAAVFQITKSDVMEAERGADYSSAGTPNTGKNEVRGIELGLVGNLTDKLSTQAGIAVMEAEVLESITPDNVGKTLSNFADNSAYLQLNYKLTPKFAFGGSATYSSEMFAGQPDTAAGDAIKIPAYTVFDLFATYEFSKQFDARLNVGNVTDEDYYLAAYRSGSFAYKGDARNVRLTLNYEF